MLTLVGDVIKAVEKGIRKGRYLPGDQLVERELANELGVSRIPVREALRRLAAQHILEIRPYRGAIVRRLSRREVTDVMDILRALGVLSISRAAERVEQGDHHKRLKDFINKKLPGGRRENKIKEWIDINFPFYQLIAEISGNVLIPDLLRQYQLQMYRLVWNVNLNPDSNSSSVEDHIAIAKAILTGDVKKALSAYEKHLKHVTRTIEAMPDSAFMKE